jgi:hypothetical protein
MLAGVMLTRLREKLRRLLRESRERRAGKTALDAAQRAEELRERGKTASLL